MRAPNHILGGFVFTGLFGSFIGFNVLEDYPSILTCVIASLLPDIDFPGSPLGRLFFPISKAINKRYGHRTITHSLIFFVATTLFVYGLCTLLHFDHKYVSIFGLALFSHLLFDMMTVQGVPFLYPFLKNRFVLPGRPDLRLNSRDVRSEIVVFCIFGFSLIFMKDLFSRGFWTSYNKQFGTIKHLHAEFLRSPLAIQLDYQLFQLSEKYEGSGILLDCSSSSFTILDNQVRHFDQDDYHFSRFEWNYSEQRISRERIVFKSLQLDSLELLLQEPSINLKIRANQSAIWQDNRDIKEGRFYSSKFNDGLVIDCSGCKFSGSLDLVTLNEGSQLASLPPR